MAGKALRNIRPESIWFIELYLRDLGGKITSFGQDSILSQEGCSGHGRPSPLMDFDTQDRRRSIAVGTALRGVPERHGGRSLQTTITRLVCQNLSATANMPHRG